MTVSLDQPLTVGGGDRLLVLQVQDDFATAGDPAPGAAMAGVWEVGSVASSTGTAVTLEGSLSTGYRSDTTRRAQACRMPQFDDLEITATGSFTADPWDGAKNGVVAFFVRGTFTLTGTARIDADRLGFRGGTRSGTEQNEDVIDPLTSAADGGRKGEGIDGKSNGAVYGRGNFATGGGGGNAKSAGGGGGGAAGAGGLGGRQSQAAGNVPNTAGLGGSAIPGAAPGSTPRLFFGGGGGAGHDGGASGGQSGAGGRGGGIVVVFARTLAGPPTAVIRADGGDGTDGGENNTGSGGGGGGAGGTILVVTSSATFAGVLRADGGDGGDAERTDNRNGPGGGGGGGRVAAPGVGGVKSASPGVNGLSLTGNDPHGSQPGLPGATQ